MFGALPPSYLEPCPDCGACVDRRALTQHACEEKRRLDHQLSQQRDEIEAFEDQLGAWLETACGRFATWLAARERPA